MTDVKQVVLKKWILLVLICYACHLNGYTQSMRTEDGSLKSSVDSIIRSFEQQLQRDVLQDNTGSISAAIFIDRKIVWSDAFGWADREKGVKADTNTIYRSGSITKTFTAFLMMLLDQDGALKINEPVDKYLPQAAILSKAAKSNGQRVTFRQLAANTGGLAEEPDMAGAATGTFNTWESRVIESIPSIPVIAAPGNRFEYSNIGYSILGLALSKAGKEPYPLLVKKKILDKLGMYNSFFVIPADKSGQVAAGCSIDPFTGEINTEKPRREHQGRGYKVPTGGLYTTANDLARFLIAQCHAGTASSPLTKSSADMMTTIQTPESNTFGYGFGYYIRTNDHGFEIIEHDGEVSGYQAYMGFVPGINAGIILLRNYNFGLTNILQLPRVTLFEICRQLKK